MCRCQSSWTHERGHIIGHIRKVVVVSFNLKKGIEAKIHYPIPIYLQKGLNFLNHKKGDFPVTDWQAENIISFPCDQHLSKREMNYVIKTVTDFYNNEV